MAYYLNLFSPETYQAFANSNRRISGFRKSQEAYAERVKPGDKLVCYMTKLSRWVGLLEVQSLPFVDNAPIFYEEDDPFVIRFEVEPLVWLEKEKAIPIHEDSVWNTLSFTKEHEKNTSSWTGIIRSSLNRIDSADGKFLEKIIVAQAKDGNEYPLDAKEYAKLTTHKVRAVDKVVTVSIPEEDDEVSQPSAKARHEVRESTKVQALIAKIGADMGMKIWLPRNDRASVLKEWQGDKQPVIDYLPLNYDDTTLKTIEQIDVLWLRGRAIVRAFEVEHTTSIYSGILRMADLLALQPNMDIKLNIVAPSARREKVFQELRRPVFTLLERGPLSEKCTYLSYESVQELAQEKHLSHLSDSVLDEYAEEAE